MFAPWMLLAVAQAAEPTPFVARYVGSQLGLGLDCVMHEAPPHGAWTVVFEVTRPRESGLPKGATLCAIVHSPSHTTRALGDDLDQLACLAVPDTRPTRFSCLPGHPPTAAMPVFDEAQGAALRAGAAGLGDKDSAGKQLPPRAE